MEKLDPRPALLRRFIIDTIPYAASNEEIQTLQDRLGLIPSGPDVLEMERNESDTRIKSMDSISETLLLMSSCSAEAIAEYVLLHAVGDEEESQLATLRNVLVNQNVQVISTAVHAIVSHLISSGVLKYGEGLDQ